MKPDGGPAFPHNVDMLTDGMSLRDYFAAQALQAVIARGGFLLEKLGRFPESTGDVPRRARPRASSVFVAELAYDFADAMLAEREKP
jgi:hypothetical protein